MIKTICNIRQTRRVKVSEYLTNYLQLLVENLQGPPPEDFRHKEALMHAFGLLSQHMAYSKEYMANAELMIKQYIFPELTSEIGFMKARASWVYGEFAHFPHADEDHLRHALNALYQCLQSPDLAVRVNAAVSLIKLLDHPAAVEFIRPGLSHVIRIYLKLIDDIDYDELIESLKKIVDVFEDEIGPYALDLCQKLSEAFLRLHEQRKTVEGSGALDLDQETSLSCEGLMTAIRRILQSISGKFPEVYPALEEILEQPILATLNDHGTESTDEGLTCLCELAYNQSAVSQRLWTFYQHIVASIMEDRGILDNYLDGSFAFVINLMNKDPNSFKQVTFPNAQNQPQTALDLTLMLGQKCFQVANEKEDEIVAISVVTLFSSLLENIQGVSEQVPGIISLLLGELQRAQTKEYQLMLLQGVLMCLWYDLGQTVAVLEQQSATESFFQFIFQKVGDVKEDFEVKRFILGLSSFLVNSEMPESVKNNYGNIIKALAFLSARSIEIRQKEREGKQKEEMAEVEEEGEKLIVEDEEDADIVDLDSEDDDAWEMGDDEDPDGVDSMYDSPLDNIDEVMHLHCQLQNLQQAGGMELHNFLMQQLG